MGLDIGFSFYKKVQIDNNVVQVEPANLVEICNNTELYNKESHYLWICGRCETTNSFSNWVERHYKDCKRDGDNKTYPEVILNDESLNGFILHNIKSDHDYNLSCPQLFYQSIEDLEDIIDFEKATQEHLALIDDIENGIQTMRNEIADLRRFQSDAKTDVAFKGFQYEIDKLKENIVEEENYLIELQEDDYDYNHAKWINDDIQEVKKIIKEHPDILVTAWTSY